MVRLALLQAILDGIAAFIGHGIAAHTFALPKTMGKAVLFLGAGAPVALYAQIDRRIHTYHTPYHLSIGEGSAEYENGIPVGMPNAKKSLLSQTLFLMQAAIRVQP